ncbi:FKBP-type peptidyl-prolyl cis-trans isomerase N-terminal domain-containing protein [Luteimonas mephitis]|uniref:FKBP-type peptidyl-prolyl cis-trans isomerase N-terminal domain-containing protein n=1 Tax=Luteimonas mephitis TaxID=83615 RepID=UPI0004011AC4|nr:FKBP-type peptidyl-prolyl cis-trans isomerase [Luteimonas mephitis]
MKSLLRGVAALLIALAALPASDIATAQDKQVLSGEREKSSYMVGMDVAKSLVPAADDLDLASFERAVRNGLDGGEPLIEEKDAIATGQALMQRVAARSGRPVAGTPPGTQPPAVDKNKVGLLLGADIGRSLAPLKDEVDLPVVMQALRTALAGGKTLLSDAEADNVRKSFGERMQAKLQAEAAEAATRNAAEGERFLAANKSVKGVFTTPSGLQYMVLRQGAGAHPRPSDRVRVNYRGTLLDGTVFDSSEQHGGPAEFGLNQVIAGWTEGVSMMPVGGKYRFWIPADLAYGKQGNPAIGPNSTLVFDVELLDIL